MAKTTNGMFDKAEMSEQFSTSLNNNNKNWDVADEKITALEQNVSLVDVKTLNFRVNNFYSKQGDVKLTTLTKIAFIHFRVRCNQASGGFVNIASGLPQVADTSLYWSIPSDTNANSQAIGAQIINGTLQIRHGTAGVQYYGTFCYPIAN